MEYCDLLKIVPFCYFLYSIKTLFFSDYNKLLIKGCQEGNIKMVKEALDNGADDFYKAVEIASMYGDIRLLEHIQSYEKCPEGIWSIGLSTANRYHNMAAARFIIIHHGRGNKRMETMCREDDRLYEIYKQEAL